jgi:integrase
VRWIDLNLDGIPVVTENDMRLVPVVAVRQNVYPVKGKGLVVHGGKTATALRVVPLPEFVTARMRERRHDDDTPEWPVFAVREQVGLGWMTPHSLRRTYATILDDEMSLTDRAKADLMGQAKFLKDTYVSRGELHPDAAVFLDAALR